MSLTPLIQHLQNDPLRGLVEQLQREIGSDSEHGPCVYFIASYERIARIAESGGILPRNAVPNLSEDSEISATSVQARRKKVDLGDWKSPRQKEVHDCLNFFFNPFNTTLWAMTRNSLITFGRRLQLGILEIPLQNLAVLIHQEGGSWTCTNKNVAKNDCYESTALTQISSWTWQAILDGSDEGRFKDERAAELLLWLDGGDGRCSSRLPVDAISRVLLPEHSPMPHLPDIPRSTFPKHCQAHDYLKLEGYIQNFENHQHFKIGSCLDTFQEVAKGLPFTLNPSVFKNPDLAVSREHGIPHVTRVMLWTHYLSQPAFLIHCLPRVGSFAEIARNPHSLSDNDIHGFCDLIEHIPEDALLAAMLHDLRRDSNQEDDHHGEDAAKHFSDTIRAFCSGDETRTARIQEAISGHCRSDEACLDTTNPVWMILKDADALDRGRFAGPCEGADFRGQGCVDHKCQKHSGCVYKTLRLSYEGIPTQSEEYPFRKNLAWAARNVAAATKSAPWDFQSPTGFLVRWLQLGQKRLELENWEFEELDKSFMPATSEVQSAPQTPKQEAVDPKTIQDIKVSTEFMQPHVAMDCYTVFRVGTWVEDSNYGIGRVLEINTRTGCLASGRVWFAKSNAILASHPLRGQNIQMIAETRVPADVLASCPPPPWDS